MAVKALQKLLDKKPKVRLPKVVKLQASRGYIE